MAREALNSMSGAYLMVQLVRFSVHSIWMPNCSIVFVSEYLMWSGFSVDEMLGVHSLQALVLFQVTPHLHMFWVGLEVCVCCSGGLLMILQLERQRWRQREKNTISK